MGNPRLKPPPKTKGKFVIAHDADNTPPEKHHPAFCLRYLDKDNNYCLSKCNRRQKAAFADKVHKLGKMSWAEVRMAPSHGLGYEPIAKNRLRKPLPRDVSPDVQIIAFRFSGKAPMVGYRKGKVFYVLWFDRKFKLYYHGS